MPIGNPIQKNNDTRVISATATTGQTDFTVTGGYTINAIGVFRNGVRLNNSTDFTAADGSTVSLNVAADAGDTVTFHIFDKFTVANAIVGAASTQTVYGNLAVNGELYSTNFNPTNLDVAGIGTITKAIIGTGVTIDQSNIDTVGLISATTFTGNLVGNVTGDVTGTTTKITVADESSDTTCFPTFVTAATGDLPPKSGTNLTFNSSSGALTATSVNGNIVGGTVSGTTGTFSGNVNTGPVLTVTGTEGVSANLYLIADDGDDNGDGWRLNSNQDDNDLTISNNTTGSYVDKFTLLKTGELTLTNDLIIPDKIVHTGDTDTAFRFPAADTVSVETQGTERLYIKSDGKIGINTTTPYSALELQGDGGVNDATMTFTRHGTPGNGGVIGLNFYRIGTDSVAGMGAYRESAMDDAYLAFFTQPTGGNYTERVRIDSSGNTLIGITDASQSTQGGTLQVKTAACIRRFVASVGSGAIRFEKTRSGTDSHTVVQDGDKLGELQFYGSDGDSYEIAGMISMQVDGSPGSSDMPGRLMFFTSADGTANNTERMRIDSSGNVTVKTTDVTFGGAGILRINSGSTAGALNLDGGSSNHGGEINLTGGSNGGRIQFRTGQGAGQQTEKMRLSENGRLLIGHTASLEAGGIEGSLQITGTDSDNSSLTLSKFGVDDWCSFLTFSKSRNATIGNQTACTSNERLGQILWTGSDGTDAANGCAHIVARADSNFSSNNCPTKMEFGVNAGTTSAATYLTIKPSGNVEVNDGNLVLASGHGIDFSATSDAGGMTSELLDDYEEGTWTPVYQNASGGISGLSYNLQVGKYTRIGNVVYIQGLLRTTAVTVDSAGTYDIGGLPFTSTATSALGAVHCYLQFAWDKAPHSFDVTANSASMRARQGIDVGDGSYTTASTTDFNESAGSKNRIYFNGSYLAV